LAELSASALGRIGEYLAASVIEQQGWNCIFCPAEGFDLVATYQNRFMRVQVKATQGPDRARGSYRFACSTGSKTKRLLLPTSADIMALVAIDIRRVYFMPVKHLTTISVRKKPADFTDYVETRTWFHSINRVVSKNWTE
jgi:hypothetical protein